VYRLLGGFPAFQLDYHQSSPAIASIEVDPPGSYGKLAIDELEPFFEQPQVVSQQGLHLLFATQQRETRRFPQVQGLHQGGF